MLKFRCTSKDKEEKCIKNYSLNQTFPGSNFYQAENVFIANNNKISMYVFIIVCIDSIHTFIYYRNTSVSSWYLYIQHRLDHDHIPRVILTCVHPSLSVDVLIECTLIWLSLLIGTTLISLTDCHSYVLIIPHYGPLESIHIC